MEDLERLREYAERRSEPAFAELVRRHVNLVYSAPLRFLAEPQQAEDVPDMREGRSDEPLDVGELRPKPVPQP